MFFFQLGVFLLQLLERMKIVLDHLNHSCELDVLVPRHADGTQPLVNALKGL